MCPSWLHFWLPRYKLYDLHTKEVFHSRDVVFQEEVFPFKAQSSSIALVVPASSFIWPNSVFLLWFWHNSSHINFSRYLFKSYTPSRLWGAENSRWFSSLSQDVSSDENLSGPVEGEPLISSDHNSEPPQPLRRSSRSKMVPTLLKDFVQPKRTRMQP